MAQVSLPLSPQPSRITRAKLEQAVCVACNKRMSIVETSHALRDKKGRAYHGNVDACKALYELNMGLRPTTVHGRLWTAAIAKGA